MLVIFINCFIAAVFVKYCLVEMNRNRNFDLKIFVKKALIVCMVQIIWVMSFMFQIYGFDKLTVYLSRGIAVILTIVVMSKIRLYLSYWIYTNFIISMIVTTIWRRIAAADYEGFRRIINFLLVPLTTIVEILYCQLIIWLMIRLHKWIARGKKQELNPSKKGYLTFGKIVGFQILISIVLEGWFVLCYPFLSMVLLILTLLPIFIVRKKLAANYMFWLFSWIICDLFVFWFMKTIFTGFLLARELVSLNDTLHLYALVILAIYHLLLTIYFRLKAGSNDEKIDRQGGFLK